MNEIYDNLSDDDVKTLYKVLNIDTGAIPDHVNSILSTHYLGSVTLGDGFLSVKEICIKQLLDIISGQLKPIDF